MADKWRDAQTVLCDHARVSGALATVGPEAAIRFFKVIAIRGHPYLTATGY